MKLTDPQQEILVQFRQELEDEGIIHDGDSIGTDDQTLLRFLRARKFNLKNSKKMLKDCQEWRKTVEGVGIDELYRRIDPFDYPERADIFKYWSILHHKTDKKGRPINIQFLGAIDVPEIRKTVSAERHWQTIVVHAESLTREILPAASRKAGKPINECLVIVDLKGFSLGSFWQMQDLARASFQISQDYYPETMGMLTIINAPSSFAWIWSIMKRWISKETVEKVEVLGSDYREVLLTIIDQDALPAVLGGSCDCQPSCTVSCEGPWMDERVGWGPNAKKERSEDTNWHVEMHEDRGASTSSDETRGGQDVAKEETEAEV